MLTTTNSSSSSSSSPALGLLALLARASQPSGKTRLDDGSARQVQVPGDLGQMGQMGAVDMEVGADLARLLQIDRRASVSSVEGGGAWPLAHDPDALANANEILDTGLEQARLWLGQADIQAALADQGRQLADVLEQLKLLEAEVRREIQRQVTDRMIAFPLVPDAAHLYGTAIRNTEPRALTAGAAIATLATPRVAPVGSTTPSTIDPARRALALERLRDFEAGFRTRLPQIVLSGVFRLSDLLGRGVVVFRDQHDFQTAMPLATRIDSSWYQARWPVYPAMPGGGNNLTHALVDGNELVLMRSPDGRSVVTSTDRKTWTPTDAYSDAVVEIEKMNVWRRIQLAMDELYQRLLRRSLWMDRVR